MPRGGDLQVSSFREIVFRRLTYPVQELERLLEVEIVHGEAYPMYHQLIEAQTVEITNSHEGAHPVLHAT